LAFSPDGQFIVTGSSDHTAKVWVTATGTNLFTIQGHNSLLRQDRFQPSVAYAVCYIHSENEQRGLRMLVGSDDEAKVYLNGKQIYKWPTARSYVADLDEAPNITLNAGPNVLVFKVVNEALDWQGSIRFTDAQGNPLKGIKVTPEP
jgi:WD40 repeat protein